MSNRFESTSIIGGKSAQYGGAHEAYMRGEICDPAQYAKPWQGGGLSVHRNNGHG